MRRREAPVAWPLHRRTAAIHAGTTRARYLNDLGETRPRRLLGCGKKERDAGASVADGQRLKMPRVGRKPARTGQADRRAGGETRQAVPTPPPRGPCPAACTTTSQVW